MSKFLSSAMRLRFTVHDYLNDALRHAADAAHGPGVDQAARESASRLALAAAAAGNANKSLRKVPAVMIDELRETATDVAPRAFSDGANYGYAMIVTGKALAYLGSRPELCLPEFNNGALDSKEWDARHSEIHMLAERRWAADVARHEAAKRDAA